MHRQFVTSRPDIIIIVDLLGGLQPEWRQEYHAEVSCSAPVSHAYLSHFNLVFCSVQLDISRQARKVFMQMHQALFCYIKSCFWISMQGTHPKYRNSSIYSPACHAVSRNYGHLLYFSPSAVHTCQRGKHSCACDNYVTLEITAAVLILAISTHLSALCDELAELATNLRHQYTSPLLYSLFAFTSNYQ